MDDLFWAGQAAEIAVDDDAVEAVVYKTSRLSNSFANNSIGRLLDFASATKSSARWPVESNMPIGGEGPGKKGFPKGKKP
jgi:hypothetical protein